MFYFLTWELNRAQVPTELEQYVAYIPNGVLVTKSTDDVAIYSHLWRVYIGLHPPREPRGYERYIGNIEGLIQQGIANGWMSKAQAAYRIHRMQLALEDINYEKKIQDVIKKMATDTYKQLIREMQKKKQKSRRPRQIPKSSRKKRGFMDFVGDIAHSVRNIYITNNI